jgi:hypothetical protein
MRVQQLIGQDKTKAAEFSDFLLRVGEGREQIFVDEAGEYKNIKIPNDMLIDEQEQKLIDTVYPDIETK